MADKTIPLEHDTIHDKIDTPPLGPVDLAMPNGEAHCIDAESCTLISIGHNNGNKYPVIVSTARVGGRLVGILAAFTPDEARSFAASMLHTATLCDGGLKGAN